MTLAHPLVARDRAIRGCEEAAEQSDRADSRREQTSEGDRGHE
jgi:hypothetical protein